MKRKMKLFKCLLCLGILFSCVKGSALDVQNACLELQGTPATHRSTKKISDAIEKKEEISTENYEFAGNLNKSDYKYVKVYKDVAYMDGNSKAVLSLIGVKSTFRYNSKTREAKCLSSFARSVVLDPSYSVNVSSRNANKNTETGSELISIEFKSSLGRVLDKDNLEIDCDYTGHVTSSDIELK